MALARAILLAFILLAIGLAKSENAAGQEAGIPVGVPVPVAVAPDSDKLLGPGDIVSLQIIEDNTPPVMKRISDAGDLDVPIIGRVHAAGRSCADVAAQVKKQLEGKFYYTATVKLALEQVAPQIVGSAGTILVSGKVMKVGQQMIPRGGKLTVSGAIVNAGGATQFGELTKVKLIRRNKGAAPQNFIINVKAILESGAQDMDLQDADSLFVPAKIISFGVN